jgi:hypothetical protein
MSEIRNARSTAALLAAWAALGLSACYSPTIVSGTPCDPALDNCLHGQSCVATGSGNFCLEPGHMISDAGTPDAVVDAPIDVPIDAGPTGYPGVVLADRPIGYWRLDDTGSTAVDTSGNNVPGTYDSGITQGVAGAIVNDTDTAAGFGGAGAISLGNAFNFTGTTAFSIEAWIKPSTFDNVFRHVFTREKRSTPREGYAVLVHGGGDLIFERFNDDDDPASFTVTAALPSTGFAHVVCTYDGAVIRLYVNGAQVGQNTDGRGSRTVTEPTVIGAASLTEGFFAGSIDEVAVYAAALTPARVQDHYRAGSMP